MPARTRSALRTTVPARVAALGLTLMLSLGCHRWQPDAHALTSPQPERRRLLIWTRGGSMEVHGVRVVGDTVLAVPYWMPPGCDSCAVRIPRSDIDSVRVQTRDERRSTIAIAVVTVLVIGMFWLGEQLAGLRD